MGTFRRGGLGGLDLARFRASGGCFRPKTGFSAVVAHGGYVLCVRKLFLRRAYFGFADLWPRFWDLDVPGGIGIGIPCFASTGFDNAPTEDDNGRGGQWPATT